MYHQTLFLDPFDHCLYCSTYGTHICLKYPILRTDAINIIEEPSMPDELSKSFVLPGKTLKLKVKEGTLLTDAVVHAQTYLNSQEDYSRIEFKFGKNYIVVAKLKE